MEQGIEGVCENTFQVPELPEYLIYEARNVEIRILSSGGILSSYEECNLGMLVGAVGFGMSLIEESGLCAVVKLFLDKVGPNRVHNKVVTQARFHEMFWLAKPALKFRSDSAKRGTLNEDENVF